MIRYTNVGSIFKWILGGDCCFYEKLFNSTFKINPYLERAMMTGITRVSKESIFSYLNNLLVVTTTSEQYETYFDFSEEEVFLPWICTWTYGR